MADDGQLFAAWLLDAQQRDLIEVRPRPQHGKGGKGGKDDQGFAVRLTGRGSPRARQEESALLSLAHRGQDWANWDDTTSQKRRRSFESAWQELKDHHAEEAGVPGSVAARVGPAGPAMGGAAAVLALVLALFAPGGAVVVVVGLVLAWGASVCTDHTLRTAVAHLPDDRLELWREVEGLRRFVSEALALISTSGGAPRCRRSPSLAMTGVGEADA